MPVLGPIRTVAIRLPSGARQVRTMQPCPAKEPCLAKGECPVTRRSSSKSIRNSAPESDRDTLEAAVDSAERREPVGRRESAGARYEEDAPAEAIPTSGTYGAETETPRSGLRSRFPQSEAAGGGYDAYDRQPGHLRPKAAPGTCMPR